MTGRPEQPAERDDRVTDAASTDGPVVILVVGGDRDRAERLATDVRAVTHGIVMTHVASDDTEAVAAAARVHDEGGVVPVVFVETDGSDGAGSDGAATAIALHLDGPLRTARLVLVTDRASLHGVDGALQVGAVHGMITRPWTPGGLAALLRAQLATFLVEHAPDFLGRFDRVLDDDDRRLARRRAESQRSRTLPDGGGRHPLLDPDVDPDELEQRLVTLLDRALGHPPRLRVAPGTILIEEGEDVGGIYVLLDGVVRMSTSTPSGDRILHESSTGPILGVLSLASHERAMLRCQAVTDVRAIPVTIEQLARAFAVEPELSGSLLLVLLNALATRLRRSDRMQIELDQSLAALSEARARLVATARFTAVGEMAAGMAHELNNPTAALTRGLDHLAEDVLALVDDPEVARVLERRRTAEPVPTAQARATRRRLTEALGDRQLADRLVAIGVTDTDEARRLTDVDPRRLDRLEAAARLGGTVRTVTGAADSIHTLVASLRSYLRGDDARGPLVPDVDVTAGIDDAVRLLAHRLGDVTVERRYDPIPTITARPGALQQVWTNLMTNALDAMGGSGTLTLEVGAGRPRTVSVRVIDDGPGVPEGIQDRIFEPRFTTADGKVRFGMGLGLSISRQIVEEHGGRIDVESRPGRTVFRVDLPIDRDDDPDTAHDPGPNTERDRHTTEETAT